MADEIVAETPRKTSWVPTRKWFATQITLLGGIAVNAIDTGFGATEEKALVLWAVAALVGYLVPNA